jgi:transcription initiation factor TFIID subunit TAF12
LDDINNRPSPADQCRKFALDEDAQTLLLQYTSELAASILEQACQLSRHRKSGELETADLQYILGEPSVLYSVETL